MDEAWFARLKKYVDFAQSDAELLTDFAKTAKPHFEPIVDDFYATITAHPTARNVITGGEAQVQRLKQTLVGWMESVLTGPHDQAYIDAHLRIGRVHVRIGLPQEYMFTAMNRIRNRLLEVAFQTTLARPEHGIALSRAINQILDLELAIMLHSYREDLLGQIRGVERSEVAEAVPAFVLALDLDDNIELWNHALAEVTGSSQSDMIGTPGRSLIGDQGGDRTLPLSRGGHRLVRWRVSRPSDSPGRTFAVGVDVTDEREMMRRTLRAERLAAVGTLAAGLAHEVRNPLNSATLQLQVLRRRIERGQTEPESTLPVCAIVVDEIRRLDRLVSEFLAFAQPRPLDLKRTLLSDVIEAVVTLIRPEAEAAGVRLELYLAPHTGYADVEPERLRQVLLNLMRNATEAMTGRGGSLEIHTRAVDAQGNVTIEVVDTGPGFPEDSPVFDAFYTTKETGTGLGLAIVHRIVSEHGGSIQVQSRPGCTRFSISLPQEASPIR